MSRAKIWVPDTQHQSNSYHTPRKSSNDLQQMDICTWNQHIWVSRDYLGLRQLSLRNSAKYNWLSFIILPIYNWLSTKKNIIDCWFGVLITLIPNFKNISCWLSILLREKKQMISHSFFHLHILFKFTDQNTDDPYCSVIVKKDRRKQSTWLSWTKYEYFLIQIGPLHSWILCTI